MELVKQYGTTKWRVISKYMQKSMIKCHTRYLQLTEQSDQANSRWTKEQDEILLDFVKKNGEQNWGQAAALIPGRIAKQCRERWLYQLNPNIKKNKWTVEEDVKVVKLYLKLGSKWTEISKQLPGRTDNNIKNRFNQSIKARMAPG